MTNRLNKHTVMLLASSVTASVLLLGASIGTLTVLTSSLPA